MLSGLLLSDWAIASTRSLTSRKTASFRPIRFARAASGSWAIVELLDELGGATDLLDDRVAGLFLDDHLVLSRVVAQCVQEPAWVSPDHLVLDDRELEDLRALGVGALADERYLVGDPVGGRRSSDPLVRVPERHVVPRDPLGAEIHPSQFSPERADQTASAGDSLCRDHADLRVRLHGVRVALRGARPERRAA